MNFLWDQFDPGFLEPVWLGVGLLAVVAMVLLAIGTRRRRDHALKLFAATHLLPQLTRSLSPGKRRLKQVLLIVATALLFTAMARPHLFFRWSEETRTGLDILLAMDCSKSMLTQDVKPSRLERAQLAVSDFADHLPDNRLGLIAFAGDAFLECPLTLDHEAFQNAVRELDTDTIPKPGTDIATAIEQAVTALKSQPNNLKFMILVTDGEDLEGRVLGAAKAAAREGLKIYTVGVGTAAGGLIEERDDTGGMTVHRDANGQPVQSKLDEATLRQIAQITGGAYEPLGQRGEGLEAIYDRYIAPLPKQHYEERREKICFEQFEWPLGLAIFLLMWEFLIRERAGLPPTTPVPPLAPGRRPAMRRRPNATAAPALLIMGLVLSGAGAARATVTDVAERDYKSGRYADAAQKYGEATETQPARHDLLYDQGASDYKAGEFSEAEAAFRKALATPDLKLQENAYYDLGNTQFKHGEAMEKVDSKRTQELWERSLHSYESALKLKDASDTRYNYEVVKKKLEQLKQQQQQQQQNQKNQQPNNKGQSGQNSQSGKDKDQQQQQKNQGKGGQDSSQQQQPGDQNKPGDSGGENKETPPAGSDKDASAQQRARSTGRTQDKQDPGIKSRQEAEALLDSLRDDERHVTARTLNGNNEPPPPPPSGKDW